MISPRAFQGCYLLISEKQTWFEAVETCADKGGHIVEVDSEEEWGALGTLSLLMGGEYALLSSNSFRYLRKNRQPF